MEAMRASGGTVSFDPNLGPSLWLDNQTMRCEINSLAAKADWVLPGIGEGEILTGSHRARDIADFYLEAGASEVVVKLDPESAWWQNHEQHVHVPGLPVENVVDTVGAGDGFAVGFISARLKSLSPELAVWHGNAIASCVIGFVGDSKGLPDQPTLEQLIEDTYSASSGDE